MPQLRAFRAYFEEHPPLHLIAGALAGIGPTGYAKAQTASPAMIAALEALLANSSAGGRAR